MVVEWYYGHGESKVGPFSQQQMKDMAASGEILPMDTVWKKGIEKGVMADSVKNLFAPPPPETGVSPNEPQPAPTADEGALPVDESAQPDAPSQSTSQRVPPPKKKQGRAVALKGADIVNQDGTQARYRMKCTECGHKDSASHVVSLLMSKSYKLGFYCAKCKRRREVGIQTYAGS